MMMFPLLEHIPLWWQVPLSLLLLLTLTQHRPPEPGRQVELLYRSVSSRQNPPASRHLQHVYSHTALRGRAGQTFQLSWCSRLSEWYILSFCLVLHLSETSCTLWDSYRRLSGGNILSSSSSSEVLKSYSWSLRRRMLHLIPHKHYFTRYAHLQFDWSTNNITTTRLHPTIFLVVQENYIWHFLLQSIVFNSILTKSVPLDTIYWSWAILTLDRVASVASFHTPYYEARVLLDAISGSEIFTF